MIFDFVSSLYILRMNLCQIDVKKDFCPFCRSSLHSVNGSFLGCIWRVFRNSVLCSYLECFCCYGIVSCTRTIGHFVALGGMRG